MGRPWATLVFAGLMMAAAQALRLSDLPTDPAVACAETPDKVRAFAVCRAGASGTCCRRLDAIYSNSSSPAAGCLCIPQVLYGTINATARFTINLLPLLQICAASHGMQTDWALKAQTRCPPISITDSVVSLLPQLGDARITSPDRPLWAWSNLLQAQDVMAKPDLVLALAAGPVLGMQLLQNLLLMMLCTPGVALVVHGLLLAAAPRAYRQLDVGPRLVTLQHAVFAVVFLLQLVPQTLMAVRLLFKAWTASYVAGSGLWDSFVGVLTMIAARGILYLTEAAVRVSVRTSWLLLFHHGLFFLILVLGVWTTHAATLVFGAVLDLWACHEALLYATLVAYRLQLPSSFTAWLLAVALGWYVLTRLAQTAMLIYMIACWASVPVVRSTPAFVVVSVLCGVFMVIQAWTLVIYSAIWRKIKAKAGAPAACEAAGMPDVDCCVTRGGPDATLAGGYAPRAPALDHKKQLLGLGMGPQGSSTAWGGSWLMAGWGRSSSASGRGSTVLNSSP